MLVPVKVSEDMVCMEFGWPCCPFSAKGCQPVCLLAGRCPPSLASPRPPSAVPLLPCRVVDLLLPGENVLQALRRLAAVRLPAGAAATVSTAGSGGGSGGGGGSPAADTLAQHVRALRGPAMPPAVREKFEQLVRLAGLAEMEGATGLCPAGLSLDHLSGHTTQPAGLRCPTRHSLLAHSLPSSPCYTDGAVQCADGPG